MILIFDSFRDAPGTSLVAVFMSSTGGGSGRLIAKITVAMPLVQPSKLESAWKVWQSSHFDAVSVDFFTGCADLRTA